MKNIKILIKKFIPPIFINFYENKFNKYGFFGKFSSWEEAMKSSEGYDSNKILEKVKTSLLKVKNGEAVYERDSVLFDKIEYSWPLLASLLWIASQNSNKLNLIDFGGSLGTSYFQNRSLLKHLNLLKWNIVEQEKFVECGRKYFKNEHVKFYYNLEECIEEQNPDIILFSSVIQYVEDPFCLLEKVINLDFKYIIFTRTPFLTTNTDILTIQKVPPKIYEASYPAWFFSEEKFKKFFFKNFELIIEFDDFEKANIPSKYKGFIFKRLYM